MSVKENTEKHKSRNFLLLPSVNCFCLLSTASASASAFCRCFLPLPSAFCRLLSAAAFCFCLLLLTGCQPNQAILESQNKSQTPNVATNSDAPQINDFERDVQTMQTANFDFIYVLRRKDSGKLTAEDKKFAKDNAPFETNRFIISDQERAIIAGSNTRFAPVNLEALKSGFEVTDLSKPEAELKNANTNSNANANK